MNTKLDRRKKYTRMVITESFVELLKDNSMDKITVKKLCEVADINRSTFYAHFADVYDVMESIETDLYEKFQNILSLSAEHSVNAEDIFGLIYENKTICEVILGKNGDINFLKNIIDMGENSAYVQWNLTRTPENSAAYTFISMGSVGVIRSWIADGMVQTPAQIAYIIDKLTGLLLSGLA